MTLQLDFVLMAGLSMAAGLLIGLCYARAYRGLVLSPSFVHTCVVTVPLTATMVYAVRAVAVIDSELTSQALAFSLVGLLGLVRFRTVVRDTREFTFVILAIATGVGMGSRQYVVSGFACILVLLLLLVLERCRFGAPRSPSLRARVTGRANLLEEYRSVLAGISNRADVVSIATESDSEAIYSFEIIAKMGHDLASVATALRGVEGTTDVKVSLLQRGSESG